jgi:hypothetical protein
MVEVNAPVLREPARVSNKPENKRAAAPLLALLLGRIPAVKGSTTRPVFGEDAARCGCFSIRTREQHNVAGTDAAVVLLKIAVIRDASCYRRCSCEA